MRSGPDPRSRGRFARKPAAQRQQGSPQRSQNLDSNGPDIRIRGNAAQIYERYLALAREAAISDDRIAAENYYQHAEHYFRINNAGRDRNSPETSQPIDSGGTGELTTAEANDLGADRSQSSMDDDHTR